jgi:hypothetical protein
MLTNPSPSSDIEVMQSPRFSSSVEALIESVQVNEIRPGDFSCGENWIGLRLPVLVRSKEKQQRFHRSLPHETSQAVYGRRFVSPITSDDCTKGRSHALTCSPESNSDSLAGSDRMRECRSLRYSRMFESDSFDSTTEKRLPFFYPIERDVQLCNNRIGFIGDNHHFNIDLFI